MPVQVKGPVLLLIGPIGIFFSRLAAFFVKNSVEVHKIHFPMREIFFARGVTHHYFKQPPEAFEAYLAELIARHDYKQIYMSGDFYNIHSTAIKLANKLGIDAYVFELGYVRPNYITLEKNRVNARSNLNQHHGFYQSLPTAKHLPKPKRQIARFAWRELFVPLCFALQCFCRYQLIPHDHRSQPKLRHLYHEVRGALLKYWFRNSERATYKRILSLDAYFLVPLQVNTDSQITIASDYQHINDFICDVITSFSKNAKKTDVLIIKHHPADRSYNNYRRIIYNVAKQHGVSERVIYIHDFPLGKLFKRCKGVVTINSTVGIEALQHLVPTKVMGKTFYDISGLTYQGKLDKFWQKRGTVNKALFKKFYRHAINATQVNGSFHGEFPFDEVFQLDESRATNEVVC